MENQDWTAPSARIKAILKEKHLVQQDLAEKMGVQTQTVKQLLNKPVLRTDTLKRIADALGVPIWQLFASPEDVAGESGSHATGRCPHCGKPITFKTIIE